jgi:serine/threonine protein kinase
MPVVASVDEFVDAMRRCDLPEAGGWEETARNAPGAEELAREFTRLGFLTAFQARQLLQSRGADLVIGPFLLLELLGAGGMGQVFKARHRLMNRVVALKVMLPTLGEDADVVSRFRQEVRSVSRLTHPNVVTAFHAEHGPRGLLLAMEFCEGRDLGRAAAECRPFPVGSACECIAQAALGLSAAHAVGLVHRDIKPSNLFLTTDGTVKILDFGLARVQQGTEPDRITRAGSAMGTPDFMAPEQARDAAAVDIRGDIYALGCTFYFLLTGQMPFPGGTPWGKIARHQNETPEAVELLRPAVPAALVAVVRKMMARNPPDRFQTPDEVVAALAPFRSTAVPPQTVFAQPVTQPLPPLTEPTRPPGPVVPDSVSGSSPFAFPETPAPTSGSSTPTASEVVRPTVVRTRPRPPSRTRWPIVAGAACGLALVVGAVAIVLGTRGTTEPTTATSEVRPTIPADKPGQTPGDKKSGSADDKRNLPAGGDKDRPRVDGSNLWLIAEPLGDIGLYRIAYSPSDPDVLAVARGQPWNPAHGGVELWNANEKKLFRPLASGKTHPPVFALAFSHDGAFFAYAAGSPDVDTTHAAVAVYEARTWFRRCEFKTESAGVLALAFSRDDRHRLFLGTRIVHENGSIAGGIEVWDGGAEWKEPKRLLAHLNEPAPVTALAVSRVEGAGSGFAAGAADRGIRFWQPNTAIPVPALAGGSKYPEGPGDGWVIDLSWAPNGRSLAAAMNRSGEGRVRVWSSPANPDTASTGSADIGHEMVSVAFLPDSTRIVTGDMEGVLRVWDTNPVRERVSGRRKPFRTAPWGLALSPDGQTLAVGGEIPGTRYAVQFLPVADLIGK